MATEPFLQAEPALADVAKQLEHWRQTHPAAPDRIPTHFWDQAVVLATLLPRSHIAERLHLSPTELQKRCLARQEALLAEAASPHPGFVEVTPDGLETPAVPQAAVIEIERPDGVRLRLQYQDAPPLAVVLRAFLEVAPCYS
jgi:AraC-like DNA-binding protein